MAVSWGYLSAMAMGVGQMASPSLLLGRPSPVGNMHCFTPGAPVRCFASSKGTDSKV